MLSTPPYQDLVVVAAHTRTPSTHGVRSTANVTADSVKYKLIMVEVSLTVGKLDASLALLLTKDHHLIEFPTILLPNGVKSGSIVKIRCDRDLDTETEEAEQFQKIQEQILSTFGKNLPQNPVLKVKNVTQTSCVLEWEKLDLGTASLKNLVLFKDGKKLGSIPQPLTNTTSKLSGLPIDKTFKFQLRLDTTAGIYSSDTIEVKTHKMTNLSGITVCLGDIASNEHFTVDDIQATLKNMGAHYPADTKLRVDTTHYITTRENKQNPEFLKANEMNIPIIRPEWLKACERERRIVGVRDFYVKDCALPEIFARNYWQKTPAPPAKEEKEESQEVKKSEDGEKEDEPVPEVKIEPVPEVKIEPAPVELEKKVKAAEEQLTEDVPQQLQESDQLPEPGLPASEVPAVSEKAEIPEIKEPDVTDAEAADDAEKEVTLTPEAVVDEVEVAGEDTEGSMKEPEDEVPTAEGVSEVKIVQDEVPGVRISQEQVPEEEAPEEKEDIGLDLGSTPPVETTTTDADAGEVVETPIEKTDEATASTEFDEVDISAPSGEVPLTGEFLEKDEADLVPGEDLEDTAAGQVDINDTQEVHTEASEEK